PCHHRGLVMTPRRYRLLPRACIAASKLGLVFALALAACSPGQSQTTLGPRPSSPAQVEIVQPTPSSTLTGTTVHIVLKLAGVPLYDGVVVAEPYRYLHPTGGQAGDPTSATDEKPVSGNQSPFFAAATEESPPQAQLVAMDDAFQLNPGSTHLNVSITAVDPVA